MSYKNLFLLFPLLLLFTTCTANSLEAAGEQKIQIRLWRNSTPNLVDSPDAATGILNLDVAQENAIEFDIKLIDNHVYVAYITDKSTHTALRPAGGWGVDGVPPELLNGAGDPPANMEKYSIISTQNKEIYIGYDGNNIEIIRFERNAVQQGNWLRVFKGTQDTPISLGRLTWEPIFITRTPMAITDPTILSPMDNKFTMAVVSNRNTVAILYDKFEFGAIEFLYPELPLDIPVHSLAQLNTWTNNNLTFLSVVADESTIITGSLTKAGAWIRRSIYHSRSPILDFQVRSGINFPFAVWSDPAYKGIVIAIYQTSDDNKTSWVEIDRMKSLKRPRLSVESFMSIGGDLIENTYIGTVHETFNFFQLYRTAQLDSELRGPLISEWNEIYDIAGNNLGQVLFVRADFNRQLSFAGLNTLQQWEQIQRNNPPPVLINPNSKLETFFIHDGHSLTTFRTSNGSIYILSGVR